MQYELKMWLAINNEDIGLHARMLNSRRAKATAKPNVMDGWWIWPGRGQPPPDHHCSNDMELHCIVLCAHNAYRRATAACSTAPGLQRVNP